jgi:hypothetical protein
VQSASERPIPVRGDEIPLQVVVVPEIIKHDGGNVIWSVPFVVVPSI